MDRFVTPPAPASLPAPKWMTTVLYFAAAYNVIWGAVVVLFPRRTLDFLGVGDLNYPQFWQCIGMIVGVYGLAYAIAARDPVTHRGIILVGLLGKIFGPVGFAVSLARGELPLRFGITLLANDLVWWMPFTLMLVFAYRDRARKAELPTPHFPRQ
jgi:small multidrug resistance pump